MDNKDEFWFIVGKGRSAIVKESGEIRPTTCSLTVAFPLLQANNKQKFIGQNSKLPKMRHLILKPLFTGSSGISFLNQALKLSTKTNKISTLSLHTR